MLVELLLLLPVGILLIVMGLVIWRKEKITLIHEYHWENVADEDKPAYTALIGKGVLVIGVSIVLTGLVDYLTNTGWGWLAFGTGIVIGIELFLRAQFKYNRGR